MLSGAITAMVSPLRDGQIDEERLRANVEFQISEGIDGLVPCGTTGESPTLTHDEHDRVIQVVVEAAAGRVPVIAGTGSNSTSEALRLTQHAKAVGADASLQVNPYYNKPTQEGLYRHFMKIADEADLDLVLYNIPGRTSITMAPATVVRLAAHPRIIAIKEATGSMDIASEIASLCDITILSGDDSLTLPLGAIGGKGVISVLSNLIPKKIGTLARAVASGDLAAARPMHLELFSLIKGVFVETNPIPIKAAMQMAGMDTGEVRLPLCPLSETHQAGLESLLKAHGVIESVSA
jgi:4-hydroxy-tetrahydrodipicolinate synthase